MPAGVVPLGQPLHPKAGALPARPARHTAGHGVDASGQGLDDRQAHMDAMGRIRVRFDFQQGLNGGGSTTRSSPGLWSSGAAPLAHVPVAVKTAVRAYRMPFDPLFCRAAERKEVTNSWVPSADADHAKTPVTTPREVEGFIVALPTEWTRSENNLFSGSHIRTIAFNEAPTPDALLAQDQPETQQRETTV